MQPSRKRPRVLVACQRCKQRRQKCDNESPACSNCSRAGAECLYNEKAYPPSYVRMLEERLKHLEGKLNTNESQADQPSCLDHVPPSDQVSTLEADTDEPVAERRPDRLAVGVGLLSSCAAAEPHYFGFSAGLSLAHFVQVAIDLGSSSSDVALPLLADRPFSNQVLGGNATLASLPSFKTGASYIEAYLSIIHPLYPFLDRKSLWQLNTTVTRRDGLKEAQVDLALIHLVYAIGSRCLQLLGKLQESSNSPESYFLSSMKIISDGLKFTSIRSIEITLLLAIHSMRSPSGTSVWHLSGLAIRQCLELGLHKQRVANVSNIAREQHRKRLFWSAYIFERKTALVLGRPFALSDEEIDVSFPLNVSDNAEEVKNLVAAMESRPSLIHAERTTLSLHRAHIELYQIHTQIRLMMYQVKKSKSMEEPRRKIKSLFQQLENWKDEVLRIFQTSPSSSNARSQRPRRRQDREPCASEPEATATATNSPEVDLRSLEVEKAELILEYHKARRSLLQPLMTEGQSTYPFDTADYAACADASGQICQLYRRLHRLSPTPFSLRDLHAVFVAGFTLIYCICACPTLYSAHLAVDIGACSTVLYVITEQWSSAKKYRDAFEMVAEKTMESMKKLQETGSPEKRFLGPPPATSPLGGAMSPGDHDGPEQDVHHGMMTMAAPDSFEYNPKPSNIHSFAYVESTPVSMAAEGKEFCAEARVPTVSNFSIEVDLESNLYDIEDLLSREGLDWFTGAVF